MKLLLQSAMIFFGTLIAAAVVALGEPVQSDFALAKPSAPTLAGVVELASSKPGANLR
ncbi:MAG: hypothetical protein H7322_14480 [Ramlibacter sp.]|nr:hypothetical protein [Ramlibacter sp.]